MGETKTPPSADVIGPVKAYDQVMTLVYLADAMPQERAALRLVLLDLEMQVVGEAADWTTLFAEVPRIHLDMVVIDWDLLPTESVAAIAELRLACPGAIVIVLISHLDARLQAARSAGVDVFISKGESADRVSKRLRVAAGIQKQ